MAFNVQGSITVRRLRTGATISLTATTSAALQQFVNIESGSVTPDWTIEANQPIITPVAEASSGTVYMSNGTWSYNGSVLDFSDTSKVTSEGWIIDSTTGKFAMDAQTFALRIIDNLASTINYASDTLEFNVMCTYEGMEVWLTWTTDITILQMGSTGYQGYLYSDNKTLTTSITSTNVHAQLLDGMSNAQGFFTKWYKNYVSDTPFTTKEADGTTATIVITADDVNGGDNDTTGTSNSGGTLFICQFFKEQSDTSPVATAAITIADEADEFSLVFQYTSTNKQLSEGNPVEVTGYIYSISQGDITEKCTDVSWELAVLDNDLEVRRKVDTQSVTITLDDSEDDQDVNVVGDVSFTYTI